MPTVRVNQLQGKTLTLKTATPFFRVSDVNSQGDNARAVSNLPSGYQFKVDSYLQKGPAYTDMYGLLKAKRSNDYLTFFGKDGKYYAINTKSISVGAKGLKEACVKTVKQEEKEAQEAALTPIDKALKFGKWIIIGVAAIWAAGYIIKSTKK